MDEKKFFIYTFGCQMNVHDSEIISGYLNDLGYEETTEVKEADIIMINTCTIRETADNKVFALLGRLRALKENKPNLIIGISGCLTQQSETARKIKNRFPFVDLIIGTHNTHQLPELIHRVKDSKEPIMEIWSSEGEVIEELPFKREKGIKAWVTITYGCNNFCTYCIVPYVRGRERSRKPENIIDEINSLLAKGYQEVTLLGQNVNSYGKDFQEKYLFADLLKDLNKLEGLERIRYMTSHPRDFNKELVHVIADCEKVCEHFHLPIQSGSNKILKKMNRGYSREAYLELVGEIKKVLPNSSISSDIIVGFPGESEDDFSLTLDIVEKVQFDHSFTFIYNKRSGTPAARLVDQIPESTKKERIKKLIALQNQITLKNNQREVGKTLEILVEGKSKTNNQMLSGRTRTSRVVVFPGNEELVGKLVSVKIENANLSHLEGVVEEKALV